jgi:hypothetical protein
MEQEECFLLIVVLQRKLNFNLLILTGPILEQLNSGQSDYKKLYLVTFLQAVTYPAKNFLTI